VHKYPFQDEAFIEDLGADVDAFNITGYILQKPPLFNYLSDRDKLIAKLKEPGPGMLVHRYLGNKVVSLVGKARMSETSKEGGIARFTMRFVEAGKNRFPDKAPDPKGLIDAETLDIVNSALDDFAEAYDKAQSVVDDINSSMQMMKSTLRTLKNIPATVISQATALVTNATSLAAEFVDSPCDLANSILGAGDSFLFAAGMLDNVVDRAITGSCSGRIQNPVDAARQSDELAVEDGGSLVSASLGMADFGAVVGEDEVNAEFGGGLPKITVASPDTAQKQANRQVNTNMTKLFGFVQACRIAVRIVYKSQQDAQAILLQITNKMDEFTTYLGNQAGDTTLSAHGIAFSNDGTYQSVKNLRAALKTSMDALGVSLAQTVHYPIGVDVVSTLKVAYDQYQDLDRANEIVTRNKNLIFHPGFLPGGKTIDILSK